MMGHLEPPGWKWTLFYDNVTITRELFLDQRCIYQLRVNKSRYNTPDRPERERSRLNDRRTDKVTPWAPDGAKNYVRGLFSIIFSSLCSVSNIMNEFLGNINVTEVTSLFLRISILFCDATGCGGFVANGCLWLWTGSPTLQMLK